VDIHKHGEISATAVGRAVILKVWIHFFVGDTTGKIVGLDISMADERCHVHTETAVAHLMKWIMLYLYVNTPQETTITITRTFALLC
jgi:hypothetical protein